MKKSPKRWPDKIYSHGQEPDPRASLANERTALAGIRTALALIAASLAIAALLSYFGESAGILRLIGIFLAIGGSVLAIMSLVHWINVEIALRNKKPLPSPNGLVTITIIVSLLGLITIVSLLT